MYLIQSIFVFQNYNSHVNVTSLDTGMEWKVKRRPDGTRYIARRPVRNKILKNRAIRISEERGLTTEDDLVSEVKVSTFNCNFKHISTFQLCLKIGRYWTKEERKKHLEKSRERKQRQEILLASRNLEENEMMMFQQRNAEKTCPATSKKNSNNADNLMKKHKTKKAHKESYNNYNAPEEHGARVPNPGNKMIGLLSVTTV